MNTVQDIRRILKEKLQNHEFVTDKSGVQTIEILTAQFLADEPFIFGTPNDEWHNRELTWYLSQSLNVNDIPPPIPKIWQKIADEDGLINSNYGWCVFSQENGRQFNNAYNALARNPYTRQAIMIYNRPSMHMDWNRNGREDFMCIQNTHHFIRNNSLISIVSARSTDLIFGYKGDYFWINYVHNKLYEQLIYNYPNLQLGDIIWQAGSAHVYSRHFKLVEKHVL
jgi:thymidylate synthase